MQRGGERERERQRERAGTAEINGTFSRFIYGCTKPTDPLSWMKNCPDMRGGRRRGRVCRERERGRESNGVVDKECLEGVKSAESERS